MVATAILIGLFLLMLVVEYINQTGAEVNTDGFPVDKVRIAAYITGVFCIVASNFLRAKILVVPEKRTVLTVTARLTMANVVVIVLAEAPALFGLALFLVARLYADFYILLLFSVYLMLRYFPRYRGWESFVQDHLGPGWAGGDNTR